MSKENPGEYEEAERVEEEDAWRRSRRGVKDSEKLERERRKAIFNALEANPNGLGFNELHQIVDDLLARQTLKDRLNEYEEEGLVQRPNDVRPGKKKKITLTEKSSKPDEVNEAYSYWESELVDLWIKCLKKYDSDNFEFTDVVETVLNERLRYDLANTVIAKEDDEFSSGLGNLHLPEEGIPKIPDDLSAANFYQIIAAELYKFYTEKIFGEVYITTDDKADKLKEDVMLEAYERTVDFRKQLIWRWEESPVPVPDDESPP